MDARQLEYFLAIVDHKGFGRAASSLHVAQPSLSQAIQTLERDLGVSLFHRVGRRVVLTEAGHALVAPARQVLRDLETTRTTVESIKGLRSGRVDIAAMPSQAVEPLTTMITRFTETCPGIVVSVQAGFTAPECVDAVRDGRCELALVGAGEEVRPPGIQSLLVEDQEFILAAPAGVPLGDGHRVSWKELAGTRVIAAPTGSRMRQVVDDIQAAGVDFPIVVEVAHREAVLPLVMNGVGVAVLTEAWTRTARRGGCQVLCLDPPHRIRISLLTRQGPLTPAAQAFRDVALASAHNTHRAPAR